jgi:transcriptional regulator with XRE-family HTH domain
VATQPKTTFRRRQLARTLRRLREAAGLTQLGAAKRLHYNNRKMSRVELAYQVPTYHDLRAMLDLYGLSIDQWDPYIELADRAREKGWYQAYGLDDYGYVSMEDEANLIREVQPGFIPGLLQTSNYTRALFASGSEPSTEKEMAMAVDLRRRRQKRLTSDVEPITVHAVLDKTVLHRELPGRVMRDQLNHLVLASELDNVTIQVLPKSTGTHQGLYGNFALLSFPDDEEPDVGYVEHVAGSVQIEKASGVAKCRLVFDDLVSKALSHGESVRLIEELADDA